MKFVQIVSSLVLLFSYDISARKVHRKEKPYPCTYSLISDECAKISKGLAACDQKYNVCKRANGKECNNQHDDDEREKDCLSGSLCDSKEGSNGWGICVDKESIGTKFSKGLAAIGIRIKK